MTLVFYIYMKIIEHDLETFRLRIQHLEPYVIRN